MLFVMLQSCLLLAPLVALRSFLARRNPSFFVIDSFIRISLFTILYKNRIPAGVYPESCFRAEMTFREHIKNNQNRPAICFSGWLSLACNHYFGMKIVCPARRFRALPLTRSLLIRRRSFHLLASPSLSRAMV